MDSATLIVTAGMGRVQRWGDAVQVAGASPTTAMTHIAIQEGLDGKWKSSI